MDISHDTVSLRMTDLLLDPSIRTWVFLPIVIITFMIGVARHYVSLIITNKKRVIISHFCAVLMKMAIY